MNTFGGIDKSDSMKNEKDTILKNEIINTAFKYHAEGNVEEASKYYQLFLDNGFTDHRVFINYGAISKQIGEISEAIDLYKKCIVLYPSNPAAYFNISIIYRDVGKLID